jgi:hypothetical protein
MDSDADVALMKLGPAVWVSGKQFDISNFVPTIADDAASRLSRMQRPLSLGPSRPEKNTKGCIPDGHRCD